MQSPRPHRATPGAWLVGACVGLVIAWRMPGDLLLNLDLVVGPEIPWPDGITFSGPELPRRTPFWVPLAAASRVVPGTWVIAGLVVATIACLAAGASRFAPRRLLLPEVVALVAATSPLLTTRIVVGHLPFTVAAVLTVWFGDRLVWPGRGRWWILLGFGLTGSSGAIPGLILFAVGWVADRTRRPSDLVRAAATQLPWLVPGAVMAGRLGLAGGDGRPFVTEVDGPLGVPRLLAGGGFFRRTEDLASEASIASALVGLAILAIVIADMRAHPDRRHVVAGVGLALAVSTALPLVGDPIAGLLGWGPLGVAREPQKFILLWLVAALWSLERVISVPVTPGPGRVRSVVMVMGVVMVSLAVVRPASFGADGRLVGRSLPGWSDVVTQIDADDVVLALPWERYGTYDVVGGRPALGPVPWLLDADDVRASGDAGLGADASERDTPEPGRHAALGRDHRLGAPISASARSLGVDVIVVFADRIQPADGLLGDPGLDPLLVEEHVAVYRVLPG